jgi:hypothetical protein
LNDSGAVASLDHHGLTVLDLTEGREGVPTDAIAHYLSDHHNPIQSHVFEYGIKDVPVFIIIQIIVNKGYIERAIECLQYVIYRNNLEFEIFFVDIPQIFARKPTRKIFLFGVLAGMEVGHGRATLEETGAPEP